jgi:GNAT superfamily N-acetyltransferase
VIRPFEPGDAQECSRILCECLTADPNLDSELRAKLLEHESEAEMLERSGLFYLAVKEWEGEIAGFGGLDLNEIRLLFVRPRHQQKGIGRAILRHLEAMVPPAVFRDMFVYASPGAVGFYRSAGFKSGGSHVFNVGGAPLLTEFMTRTLR